MLGRHVTLQLPEVAIAAGAHASHRALLHLRCCALICAGGSQIVQSYAALSLRAPIGCGDLVIFLRGKLLQPIALSTHGIKLTLHAHISGEVLGMPEEAEKILM
jgi:hypothetical protein